MDRARTVLMIGHTGNGKSTLANVITKTNRFKEGEFSISETKNFQKEIVTVDGIEYTVVDTVGIGDTGLPVKEVLLRIAEACRSVRNGFHQLLFVTAGKFTEEEIFCL